MRQLGTHRIGGFIVSVVALSEEPGAEQYIAYAERPDEDHFIGRRGASLEAVLIAIGRDVGRMEAEAESQSSGPRVVAAKNMPESLDMTDRKCFSCNHRRSQHTGKGLREYSLFHGCSVWGCECPHFSDPPLSEVGA